MGLFGRDKILDLTEDYSQQRRLRKKQSQMEISETVTKTEVSASSSSGEFGGFFDSSSSFSENSSSRTVGELGNSGGNIYHRNFDPETGEPIHHTNNNLNLDSDERKRRLARRLKNMTDKIEELTNQIYILQQKVEVLERKTKTGHYEEFD